MADDQSDAPESTAVRVALWRAVHVLVDPPPHVLDDEIGLRLVAPGSTLAMTFLLPPELLDDADRAGLQASQQGACASGTPFVSFYAPEEMSELVRQAGFAEVRHVSGSSLGDRYFADRTDELRPSTGEDFVVATT